MPSTGGPTPKESGTRRRVARVLIVDDDHLLGSVLHRMLSRDYDALVVNDATDALHRLTGGQAFDFVLCDVMMPRMDGVEFHDRLAATMPEQASRIVFMSGGGFTPRVEAFFRRVPNLLLDKPLDSAGLRALIERRVYGQGAGAAARRGA